MQIKNIAVRVLMFSLLLISAQATPIVFSLTEDGCTGGCGAGPFGTVTLTQVGPDIVGVLVELNSPAKFVNTGGPHHALVWNIAGNPVIDISDLTSGFTELSGAQSASPFGAFQYGIDCTGCGAGSSSPLAGPLEFRVATPGLTPESFTANDGGYYFAADILGSSGRTGNVAALGGTAAPEPATMFLSGTALMCMGWWLRRKRSR